MDNPVAKAVWAVLAVKDRMAAMGTMNNRLATVVRAEGEVLVESVEKVATGAPPSTLTLLSQPVRVIRR